MGAGAAISTVAGPIIGSSISAASNAAISKRQRRWAEGQTNRAYEMDLAQWNRENAYNSPEQQMARLQAADVNPNLMYGTGTSGMGKTGTVKKQVPPGQFPKVDMQIGDPLTQLSKYQDIRQKQENIALTKAKLVGQNVNNKFATTTLTNRIDQEIQNLKRKWAQTTNENLKSALLQTSTDLNRLKAQILEEDLELRVHGVSMTDNLIFRMGAKMFGGSSHDIGNSLKKSWKKLNSSPKY